MSSAATDFSNGQVKTQATDAQGPLNFVYIIESPTTARIVVIGDTDFISNGYIHYVGANSHLMIEIINWMNQLRYSGCNFELVSCDV